MKRIVLHIDNLVLHGIDRADAAALSAGLQAELQTLLGSDGGAAALAALQTNSAVQAGKTHVPEDGDATEVGRAAANCIVRGVRP